MAVMWFQVSNLVDRKKDTCINKTTNIEKWRASSNCFTPRWINSLLSFYKRMTTTKIYNNLNKKLKGINKSSIKLDQYLNLRLIFKNVFSKEFHQASIPKLDTSSLLKLLNLQVPNPSWKGEEILFI